MRSSLRMAAIVPLAASGLLVGFTAPANAQTPAATTVNSSAALNSDGTITVTGTYTCALAPASNSSPTVAVQASDGKNVSGQASQSENASTCPGTSQPYSINIAPSGGSWTSGDRIQVTVNFTNQGSSETEQATATATVCTPWAPGQGHGRPGRHEHRGHAPHGHDHGHRGQPSHGHGNHAPHGHGGQPSHGHGGHGPHGHEGHASHGHQR